MDTQAPREDPNFSKLFGNQLVFQKTTDSDHIQTNSVQDGTVRLKFTVTKIFHPKTFPASGWCSVGTLSGDVITGVLPTVALDMEIDAYCTTKTQNGKTQYVIQNLLSIRRCSVGHSFVSKSLREAKQYTDIEATSAARQLLETFSKVSKLSDEMISKFLADFALKQPELFEHFSKRNIFTGQDRNLILTYYQHKLSNPDFSKIISNLSPDDLNKCSNDLRNNPFGCFFRNLTSCASLLGELKYTSINPTVTQTFASLTDQEKQMIKFYHTQIKSRAKKEGHTYMTRDFVLHFMSLGDLDKMISLRILNPVQSGDPNFPTIYFGATSYGHGKSIGSSISALLRAPRQDPPVEGSYQISGLDGHQTQVLQKSFTHPFMMITGGPGCGKSFLLYNIIRVHKQLLKSQKESNVSYQSHRYLVLTPNGMAARRLGKFGVQAHTIAMIGKSCQNETYKKKLHSKYDSLIIDEGSQVSEEQLSMALSIFSGHSNFRQLLIFGDVNQRRPIGYGEPFKELSTKFPNFVDTLSENHRVDTESTHLLDLFRKVLQKDSQETLRCFEFGSEFTDNPCLLLQCHPSDWQSELKRIKQLMLDKGCRTVQILTHTNDMCSNITRAMDINEHVLIPGSFIKFCKNTYSKDVPFNKVSDDVCNGQSATIAKIVLYQSDLKKRPSPNNKANRKNLPRNPSPEQLLAIRYPQLQILREIDSFSLKVPKSSERHESGNVGLILDSGEFVDVHVAGLRNIKHAVAITGDSAEGSEFDGVILVMDTDHGLSEFYTLDHFYTEMTRTRSKLVVLTCTGIAPILQVFSNVRNDEKRFCNLATFIREASSLLL